MPTGNMLYMESGSMSTEQAITEVHKMIESEIEEYLKDVRSKNPKINENLLKERYIEYLRYLGDPRIEYIDSILAGSLEETALDQAVEVLVEMTKARTAMIHSKKEGDPQEDGSRLAFGTDFQMRKSLMNLDTKELIIQLSLEERKKLDLLINACVLGNMGVMAGEHMEVTKQGIQSLYTGLSGITGGAVSGDHTIGLMIIGVFGYEAYLKIKEVGWKSYFQNNKIDVVLNGLALGELGTIAYDTVTGEVHPGVASILRSLRALRLLKILSKIHAVKELGQSVMEVLPKTLQFTGIYGTGSIVVMFMLMQLLGRHIPEFNTFGGTFDQMRSLFYADGFQDIFKGISESRTIDPATKITAEIIAQGYMVSSTVFYAGVIGAMVVDSINKSGRRIEQMLALTLERVDTLIGMIKKSEKNPEQ